MRIYVVEDDPLKAESVSSFLHTLDINAKIEVYRSYISGLSAVQAAKPDLLIVDMALPTYDRSPAHRAGKLRPLGGYELLRKMQLHGISTPAIVVTMLESFGEGEEETSYEDMTRMCGLEFDELFLGSVYFQIGTSSWQTELKTIFDKFRTDSK
ncbi:response regulator [Pseudoxanthomonas sp. z9]|uniref:response regulator n=1 Tax=Pseudoxanthomonas sp. z9 TaxID=2584942 RepID=UPI001142AA11|nr:response regulator [Pseudoxanthomonas sp. z9]